MPTQILKKSLLDVYLTGQSELISLTDPSILTYEVEALYSNNWDFIGYICFERQEDYTDLLYLEVFNPYKGSGYSLCLLSQIPGEVHLVAASSESEEYFRHCEQQGYLSKVIFE